MSRSQNSGRDGPPGRRIGPTKGQTDPESVATDTAHIVPADPDKALFFECPMCGQITATIDGEWCRRCTLGSRTCDQCGKAFHTQGRHREPAPETLVLPIAMPNYASELAASYRAKRAAQRGELR